MSFDILLKILFDNTAVIAIFFVTGGLVKLFVYYKLFGIYVYEFIDIKEVITLFVSNLLGYFFVIGIISLALIKLPFVEPFEYFIPAFFSFLSLFYCLARKMVFKWEIILLNLLFWVLFIVVKKLLSIAPTDPAKFEIIKNFTLLVLLLSLIIYSIANALTEYYKVKKKSYYSGTKILMKEREIVSDSKIYYIGKTEKFLFIHDSRVNWTEVIPIDEIKNIVFRKV